MDGNPPLRAREYLRVSYDRSGRERSNSEQQDDNRRAWPGWEWGDHYSDAVSASRYSRRVRGDFVRLIDDLTADRFGADVLVLWESSRGSRKVGEWVDLLDLCEQRSVRIAVTDHHRLYDPTVPRDRRSLLEDAVDSEYESAKTSRRARRGGAASAAAGQPHGRLLYGYRRVYDPTTRRFLRQEPDPVTAPVVQRIFREYLAGSGTPTIARGLREDGICGREPGTVWRPERVREVLDNPSYAGIRTHHGEEMPGLWEGLVSMDDWELTVARRDATRWRRVRQGENVHLLTGVGRCCRCQDTPAAGRLMVSPRGQRGPDGRRPLGYRCRDCYGSNRNLARLDAWVTAALLAKLRARDRRQRPRGDDPVAEEARRRAKMLRVELDDAMELWRQRDAEGRPLLSARRYAEMEADLLPRIEAAERESRAGMLPLKVTIPDDPDGLEDWFYGLPRETRRELVAAYIERVVVSPVGRGKKNYDDGDYTAIHWRR